MEIAITIALRTRTRINNLHLISTPNAISKTFLLFLFNYNFKERVVIMTCITFDDSFTVFLRSICIICALRAI